MSQPERVLIKKVRPSWIRVATTRKWTSLQFFARATSVLGCVDLVISSPPVYIYEVVETLED